MKSKKLWVITQVYGRKEVAKVCLRQLSSVLPKHGELHVWQDDPSEDCAWVKGLPRTILHKEGRNWGINNLRWVQLRTAQKNNVDEIYLTDSDASHDPDWYEELKERYEAGYPVASGFLSAHHVLVDGSQRNAPGISMYFRTKEIRRLMLNISTGRIPTTPWDFTWSNILGNRIGMTSESVVDHFGAGGLHNPGWDLDIAIKPTDYLKEWREGHITGFKAMIPRAANNGLFRDVLSSRVADTVIINQPRGIGDILFMQPIANRLLAMGYNVDWITDQRFVSIQKHFPGVNFVPIGHYREDHFDTQYCFEEDGKVYLPMKYSDSIYGKGYEKCMESKYSLLGLDFEGWQDDVRLVRDPLREGILEGILELPVDFTLINKQFMSDGSKSIQLPRFSGPVIELKPVAGFTMVDWSGVIEKASSIHTVGTGFTLLVELLEVTNNLHLYQREEDGFSQYDYVLRKPWKFHG